MIDLFKRIVELYEKGQPAAFATVVESSGSTPRKSGARMIVFPDRTIEGTVGGGAMENRVIEEAVRIIETGESRLFHIDLRENKPDSVGAVCGGELRVFIEPVGTMPRLIIVGAGHVGQTLARMARELPWQVVVYDDRAEYTAAASFPDSVKVICGPFERAIERLQPSPSDFITIMTYRYVLDQVVLQRALTTSAGYIGMIGSELKCMRVRDYLEKEGISQEQLKRVHAPIGLPIGAHTPAEVAISILAEIVKHSNPD